MRFAAIFVVLTIVLCTRVDFVFSGGGSPSHKWLFVQSAKSGSFDGENLTLRGIPFVIYFADRPDRISGHMSLKKFIGRWTQGSDSFEVDPPNAVLSIFDEEKGAEDIVIVLHSPSVQGDEVIFKISNIKGKIPKTFGAASLFIDCG